MSLVCSVIGLFALHNAGTGVIEAADRGDGLDLAIRNYIEYTNIRGEAAEAHSSVSRKLMDSQIRSRALDAYSGAMRSDLSEASPHVTLGRTLDAIGCGEAAVSAYLFATEQAPQDAHIWYLMGRVRLSQGLPSQAASAFEKAVSFAPQEGLYHRYFASALEEEGKLEEAIAVRQRELELNPHSAANLAKLGTLLEMNGDLVAAEAIYEEALRIDPNESIATSSLERVEKLLAGEGEVLSDGRIKIGNKLYTMHRESLVHINEAEQILAASGQDDPGALLHFARAVQVHGRYNQALDAYRRVLALEPNSAEAHYGLGTCLLAKGQSDLAFRELTRAQELGYSSWQLYRNLGLSLQRQGKHNAAVGMFERGLNQYEEVDAGAIYRSLAESLYKLGFYDEARKAYEQWTELGFAEQPEPQFAQDLRRRAACSKSQTTLK